MAARGARSSTTHVDPGGNVDGKRIIPTRLAGHDTISLSCWWLAVNSGPSTTTRSMNVLRMVYVADWKPLSASSDV
jgi:hypothetical protein